MDNIPILGPLVAKWMNGENPGHVTTSDQIWDSDQAKSQSDVNKLALTGGLSPFNEIFKSGTDTVFNRNTTLIKYDAIAYDEATKRFYARSGQTYYAYWLGMDLYVDSTGAVLQKKPFYCDTYLYVWDAGTASLVAVSGNSVGGGFLNVTSAVPLSAGDYYTKERAVAALKEVSIKDELKQGLIITFEASAGTWMEFRFSVDDITAFYDAASWVEYGAKDVIKKIHVTQGTVTSELTPDADGNVNLQIPEVVTDETIDPNSTNPPQNKAVAAAIEQVGKNFGAALRLNTNGDGDSKTYSLSLLDQNGEEISQTDEFSGGGGGGSTATTKVQLTKLSANPTVKSGDQVKLSFTYDHVSTDTGESTGNAATAVVTIVHGATSNTLNINLTAGSTTTLDVTKYLGLGNNTVKVKANVDAGDYVQSQTISWNVNVVQLTLTSTFNIASVINRGDTISISYSLSGSGTKTLKMYLDGVQSQDKSITTSTSTGAFSLSTLNLTHGAHSIQLVAELELASGTVLKSNSIYMGIAVRESGKTTPIVVARFDYADGTIIEAGATPYIQTTQFDTYNVNFAAYNPKETPTLATVKVNGVVVSQSRVSFSNTQLTLRSANAGTLPCTITVGATTFTYNLVSSKSDLNLEEPTDNLKLKLTADGRTNNDANREEWTDGTSTSTLTGFTFGGDGWMGTFLRHKNSAKTVVNFNPLEQPSSNPTNAFAFEVKFKASEVTNEDAVIISCVDADGTGFVITPQEARMQTRGKSTVSMKMASGEVHEVGFVAYPQKQDGSSIDEQQSDLMLYMYIDGIASNGVQRASSDSIYQGTAMPITIGGTDEATVDVYNMRSYSSFLTHHQMLALYIIDQETADDMFAQYEENNIFDANGNITVDSVPEGTRVVIVTGVEANGVPTVLQAAVNNNKSQKYDVTEILTYVKGGYAEQNMRVDGGCIRLQGTSSLAYPIKNYRFYTKKADKTQSPVYIGCDEQGIGGTEAAKGKWSFHLKDDNHEYIAAPVNCWCGKADYAESSSSHNTGMARIANDVLVAIGDVTPAQQHVDRTKYDYDVRTTVDGEPCYMFYRATLDDDPIFLGKFNWNNDKSTEAVFGFCDIPGYHDDARMKSYFDTLKGSMDAATLAKTEFSVMDGEDSVMGDNPTECWEFLNNDYPMGMFKTADFDSKTYDSDAKAEVADWTKVFESRFPDNDTLNDAYANGTVKPYFLERLVKWVQSTDTTAVVDGGTITINGSSVADTVENRRKKFHDEIGDYFDTDYLCDYYEFTDIFACCDQRVKNMMLAFWYNPDKGKVLGYFIFYDCDTILGVRNDGRLKYDWDVDENTVDAELSTADHTVYAYAGHDSVLWANLRAMFQTELKASYKRIRAKLTNDLIFKYFDEQQSDKFCEAVYNQDAINKYVIPKTQGISVLTNGVETKQTYSYLESMQGSRKTHRHRFVTNRNSLLDAWASTGTYTMSDIRWKGNSAAGAKVVAKASRQYYFELLRENSSLQHDKVEADAEWSATYSEEANIGTIFHLYGGTWMKYLDLSQWGGFTDLTLPSLPVLEHLILGLASTGKTYSLTELAIGSQLPMLRKLEIQNYTNLSSLDLSKCMKLEYVDATGCTTMSTMSFAEASPLASLHLPENFQTLILKSLPAIKRNGIVFDNIANLTGLSVENCEQLDGYALMQEIVATSGSKLKYLRITNINIEGDGSDLQALKDKDFGGLDENGNIVVGTCKLTGHYQLTSYMDDDKLAVLKSFFDELTIKQPTCTTIEFDDSISDPANISNLDNKTGYKFNNTFKPSAHVSAILAKRHRYLAKKTATGEMTVCQLHDDNSNYFADNDDYTQATKADLTGPSGDVMIWEPKYWYKGINDLTNKKKYACYANGDEDSEPEQMGEYKKLVQSDMAITTGYALKLNETTLGRAITALTGYNYAVIEIPTDKEYKQVRVPSFASSAYGTLILDEDNNVLSYMNGQSINGFMDGMYLFCTLPEKAKKVAITIKDGVDWDYVLFCTSGNVEAIEPDWVFHDECLIGVYEANMVDDILRSVSGRVSTGGVNQSAFTTYAKNRGDGFQLIDWDMHKDIGNLYFASHGTRNAQDTNGYGSNDSGRTNGRTNATGMQETYSNNADTDEQTAYVNVGGTKANNYTDGTKTNISSPCALGYENLWGNKAEWLGNTWYNKTLHDNKLRVTVNGEERVAKAYDCDGYAIRVIHGRFMDLLPATNSYGSSTTYYADGMYAYNIGATARVVYRSNNYAYANGGVSCSGANYDSSFSNAYLGSRLAFRGTIKRAESVEAFLSVTQVA